MNKKVLLLVGGIALAIVAAAGAVYIYTQGGNTSGGVAFIPAVGSALCFYNWMNFDKPKETEDKKEKVKYDRFGRRIYK